MSSAPIAVLGGTGLAGRATVEALVARGQPVRSISRRLAAARPGVEAVSADAGDVEALAKALEGASAVVVCSRPDYWRWSTELVPMVRSCVEASRRAGCRVVFCDNLYAYGVPSGALTEDSPVHPHGPNGRARQAAVEVLMSAHASGAVEVAIGRAADFYGPNATYPNLKMLFGAALEGKLVRILGPGDVPHSVSYLGDVGAGLATLATERAASGAVWHLPVAPPCTERELAERVVRLAGSSSSIATTPAWAARTLYGVGGLFSPLLRALKEVQYQHEVPFVVDDSRFVRTFGLAATDQALALTQTLDFWRATLRATA